MYQHFIFDLYGTLLDIRTDEESEETWESFAWWLRDHGMGCDARMLRRRYAEKVAVLAHRPSAYACPDLDLLPVFSSLCGELKKGGEAMAWQSGEAFRRCSTRMLQLYPGTMQVLGALKNAGKKVYLLSNAQRVFTWRELEGTGLLRFFDDIFISSDAACKKPDPAFFHLLLDKHGLSPADCVMIGNDSATDIAGAAAVGMDAMYLRTAISPEGDPVPDCRYVHLDGDIRHVLELIRK